MKVVEECHGKTWQKRCSNCDSLLEYENKDIYNTEIDKGTAINVKLGRGLFPMATTEVVQTVQRVKCVRCPVCGSQVIVNYIDFVPVIKGTYERVRRYFSI